MEITVELISRRLLDAYDAALRFEQAGAAVAAMTALARLLGLNAAEKIDLNTQVISMPSPIPVDKTEKTVEWQASFRPSRSITIRLSRKVTATTMATDREVIPRPTVFDLLGELEGVRRLATGGWRP